MRRLFRIIDKCKHNQSNISVYFSHVLFVLENSSMILILNITYHPNAWYSSPVTVTFELKCCRIVTIYQVILTLNMLVR